MRLIGYFACLRVRTALNLAGITVEHASRHLRKGEHRAPTMSPSTRRSWCRPWCSIQGGADLSRWRSEYLEETHPSRRCPPIRSGVRGSVRWR
jgi:maleylpyruvate isomerase